MCIYRLHPAIITPTEVLDHYFAATPDGKYLELHPECVQFLFWLAYNRIYNKNQPNQQRNYILTLLLSGPIRV